MARIRFDRGDTTTVLVCDCGWRLIIRTDRTTELTASQAHQQQAHQHDKKMRDTIARRRARG